MHLSVKQHWRPWYEIEARCQGSQHRRCTKRCRDRDPMSMLLPRHCQVVTGDRMAQHSMLDPCKVMVTTSDASAEWRVPAHCQRQSKAIAVLGLESLHKRLRARRLSNTVLGDMQLGCSALKLLLRRGDLVVVFVDHLLSMLVSLVSHFLLHTAVIQ
jgi:hypothetical protein